MSPLTLLLFISFLPMLWIADHAPGWKSLLLFGYIHMLLWNALTTWWIWNSTAMGAAMAILANSLIMCVPWLLFYFTRRAAGKIIGYLSLLLYWIAFEYIHHNWELSWPWLTLGNGFALQPQWVQWYEYTGITGGSIWVLASNILAYLLFKEYRSNGRTGMYFRFMISWVLLLIIPILISRSIGKSVTEKVKEDYATATRNIVVVQPNVDPYEKKFEEGSQRSQIEKLISLSEQQIDSNTALVVWPETAIPVGVLEDEIRQNIYYQPVWAFLQRHTSLSLLTGIDSYKIYGQTKDDAPRSARFSEQGKFYYDAFNAAAMMYDSSYFIYHKSKLVPGVETLPSFLMFLSGVFANFGGISGTLGRDDTARVFSDRAKYFRAAPVICYESIYSDYITNYVRNGANVLTIMTNDGWWANTAGYKQHMNYARLRAVETRMWIARSANTGISCFIDPTGNVINPQPWDTQASIRLNIPPNNVLTFFSKYGDWPGRILSWLAGAVLIYALVLFITKRFKR